MAPLRNTRRLAIGGGVLAGVVIVYGLLNGLFPGLGGGGSGDGANVLVSGSGDPAGIPEAPRSKPDGQPDPKEESATQPESGNVVDVLIDDRSYFLRRAAKGEEDGRRIELPELIDLAKAARGNEDGIRVRIFRRKSSRASAEHLLQEKLTEAGLPKNSIHLQKGFVP